MKRRPVRRGLVTMRRTKQSAAFEGGGAYLAIKDLAIPAMRDRLGGAWLVPRQHANDVAALLESRGYFVDEVLP